MPEVLPEAEILVLGTVPPLRVGVYVEGVLREDFEAEEAKTSEALPKILDTLLRRYRPVALYYARGPGSFMAVKVIYVSLKTLSIALDIPLFAADAFAFNGGAPIRAVGRSRFVKRGDSIVVEPAPEGEEPATASLSLPKRLEKGLFGNETEPLYILPAV